MKQVGAKSKSEMIDLYKENGFKPWSAGYNEYKWSLIENAIKSKVILNEFEQQNLTDGYGLGMDERVIEYPWLITRILPGKGKFLDAGSTFNFQEILQHPLLSDKDIYIYTYHPEGNNFSNKRISYVYGDLRELPFKNNFFDQVVCHSTIEHIDMDNSMYGYELSYQQDSRSQSYVYLKVINELKRVVKSGGKVLLTFPYGKFENHGFFQQFNAEMVQRIEDAVVENCSLRKSFVMYEDIGWRFASQNDCNSATSYNPHTGKGKGTDNAAHSRAICFIEIIKN